jgi:hypothetical protein
MQAIQSYLKNQALGNIFSKAKALAIANQKLQNLLPKPLQSHCQIANFTNTYATIATNSAPYLTQLQYLKPTLLQGLQQIPSLKRITELNFTIIPHLYPPQTPQQNTPILTENAKELVHMAANRAKDKKLKSALEKLAQAQPPQEE